MSPTNVGLVVGAQGIIGRSLVGELQARGDWEVIGLSRRGGEPGERVHHVAVDLLDAADTRAKLGGLHEVTHVFYAAYQDRPTWAELVAPNVAMLVNVIDAVEPAAALRHVSLMQGYKVYGAHLGPFKTPARESDPPHMPAEFNVDQQDFLEARAAAGGWTWSALRPSVVAGVATGTPMNLTMVLAVYASISKELGVPLRFPGHPDAYDKLLELTDAGSSPAPRCGRRPTSAPPTRPSTSTTATSSAGRSYGPKSPPTSSSRSHRRCRRRWPS